MADELNIQIQGSGALAGPSRAALEKAVTEYGKRILEHAESIESARRVSPGPPMITDAAIALADLSARNGQLPLRPSLRGKALSIAETTATLATGGFAGYISKPLGAIGFAICAVIAILLHGWKKGHGE